MTGGSWSSTWAAGPRRWCWARGRRECRGASRSGSAPGLLADVYLHSDPPGRKELAAVTAHVSEVFAPLDLPRPDRAVAVGGSAASVRRMVGTSLSREALERSLQLLAGSCCEDVAARIDLHPERVRLMPAGIVIMHELSRRLDVELELGHGGLREGIVLELAAAHDLGLRAQAGRENGRCDGRDDRRGRPSSYSHRSARPGGAAAGRPARRRPAAGARRRRRWAQAGRPPGELQDRGRRGEPHRPHG